MIDYEGLRKLLRETRIEKGLSYNDLRKKTKIPSDIIKKIEEDEDFVEKNIYARMFLKQLLKTLGVSAEIQVYVKQEKIENQENINIDGKLVNTSLGLTVLSGFIFMSLAFKGENSSQDLQAYKIILETKPIVEEQKPYVEIEDKKSIVERAKSIILKAESDVWITASVDGELEIINLKSGEEAEISFFNKVVFETIGNAKSLKINFNDREVVIKKEIVHNLFVDSDGIFLNGYNLIKETKRS